MVWVNRWLLSRNLIWWIDVVSVGCVSDSVCVVCVKLCVCVRIMKCWICCSVSVGSSDEWLDIG